MSGIDKEFDYLVPESMSIDVGDKVRVVLNGRRVGGWVVAVSGEPPSGLDPSRVTAIAARSGRGVAADVVALSTWMSRRWFGPRRAVLSSASAPRVRSGPVHPRTGRIAFGDTDDAASVALLEKFRTTIPGTFTMFEVPPLVSVLPAVAGLAREGAVLVVCPTMRMASLGAAWLRRRGAEVALLPDDWEAAASGVDVVIGARSTVLAPCARLSAIVVIDAHDEALKAERSPAWDALSVARERGRRLEVPVIATSPVPPALLDDDGDVVEHVVQVSRRGLGWGRIVIEDLRQLPVTNSLLGSRLLAAVKSPGAGVLCVLNTKGGGRLVSCRDCKELQKCQACASVLTRADVELSCERCGTSAGSVCVACGATDLRVLRTGTAGLLADIDKSTGVRSVEVTAESAVDDLVGGVFVGTESLLNRVAHADAVVFCDIDRDLSAPRVTAPREVLALVARAVRIVGRGGTVILQSRDPSNPLLSALAAVDVDEAIDSFLAVDLAKRKELGLPPFSRIVQISGAVNFERASLSGIGDVDHRVVDGALMVRAADDAALSTAIAMVSEASSGVLRVHADPVRY